MIPPLSLRHHDFTVIHPDISCFSAASTSPFISGERPEPGQTDTKWTKVCGQLCCVCYNSAAGQGGNLIRIRPTGLLMRVHTKINYSKKVNLNDLSHIHIYFIVLLGHLSSSSMKCEKSPFLYSDFAACPKMK